MSAVPEPPKIFATLPDDIRNAIANLQTASEDYANAQHRVDDAQHRVDVARAVLAELIHNWT